MKEIAVVLVLVALAAARDVQQLKSILEPRRSYNYINPISENGANVGKLIFTENWGENSIVVDSYLEGLPPGKYFGLFHEDPIFNNSCDMDSSLVRVKDWGSEVVRKWVAFGVINVDDDKHSVTMDTEEKNALQDSHELRTNHPVYIYPVPTNITTRLNETVLPYDAPITRPVACGMPMAMGADDPDKPKHVKVGRKEARKDLANMMEDILAYISDNADQIVVELITIMRSVTMAMN